MLQPKHVQIPSFISSSATVIEEEKKKKNNMDEMGFSHLVLRYLVKFLHI